MSTDLYRLIYISSNCIAGDVDSVRREIDKILKVARDANNAVGVTGALMFNAGCFAQVLEGPLQHVEETFERIQCDERHSDVVILAFEPVSTRGFDSWSMAYVGENAASLQEFDHIRSESGFDVEKLPAERVIDILQQHLHDADDDQQNAVAA